MGTVEEVEQKSIAEQGLSHEGPYNVKEPQYINGNMSYNFKLALRNNLPTYYTLALRNYENFSSGCGMKQGPRIAHNL